MRLMLLRLPLPLLCVLPFYRARGHFRAALTQKVGPFPGRSRGRYRTKLYTHLGSVISDKITSDDQFGGL
jgi:hypothetical protein